MKGGLWGAHLAYLGLFALPLGVGLSDEIEIFFIQLLFLLTLLSTSLPFSALLRIFVLVIFLVFIHDETFANL